MRLLWPPLLAGLLLREVSGWNSAGSLSQIYTFQEFYTDAQYGPDFGYYSTGRILHEDGPSDNGVAHGEPGSGNQEWFNSYTTLPMSLSPDFAHALCDRLVTMWEATGRPSPFVIAEFGGGTGMLARDIMRRIRDQHGDFYEALSKYIIGERSQALRQTQQMTTAEFVAAGKLAVVEADGRQASLVRPVLEEALGGPGQPVRGLVLSNELLDEFDPVLMRLVWHSEHQPTEHNCTQCESYRETHVLHSVDLSALSYLVEGNGGTLGAGPHEAGMEELLWEGQSLYCGLLKTQALVDAMHTVAQELTQAERDMCAPNLVCCFPFLLAAGQVLSYRHEALSPDEMLRAEENGEPCVLTRVYRHHLKETNGTVPLSKERYRQLRRLASARGVEFEKAFLTGGETAVASPGHVHSHEVFLSLSAARCAELSGWLRRHAVRLSAAARLRDGSAMIFDGEPDPPMTAMHLKLVVRPGEAAWAQQASMLIDDGFLVTLDYGADADALVWNALIRPNYEGVHIMDARDEFSELCNSYLACPGLQDLTTSVDFTEVAEAGRELGGWKVRAYGPVFLLELSFDKTHLDLAPADDPYRLGHLLERAGGLRNTGLQAWYRKPEQDPWASFKLLVQHRGTLGENWSLGPHGTEWPLHSSPRLFRSPSPCWSRDLTKPPLASLITTAARHALGDKALQFYSTKSSSAWMADLLMPDLHMTPPVEDEHVEDRHVHETLLEQFLALLLGSGMDLDELIQSQRDAQQQAYADMHLALLLVDYWRLLEPFGPTQQDCTAEHVKARIAHVHNVALSRNLNELYGDSDFDRVFGNLRSAVFERGVGAIFENVSTPRTGQPDYPPYVCLASRALSTPLRR